MFIRGWKKEILTIPNLLSLLRLVLIPVCVTIYLQAASLWQYKIAGGILALSCLTDALDGQIARRCNMISTLGKILDPVADKLTQFALTVCLQLRYPVLQPVLVLFVGKEVVQMMLGIFHLHRGKMLPGALMVGKICTTVLFISLITLVFFPRLPSPAVHFIAMTDAAFLILSFCGYLAAYLGKEPSLRDLDEQ